MLIEKGQKVKIKSAGEIHKMYPDGMPCTLTTEMLSLCGTIQTVSYMFTPEHTKGTAQIVRLKGLLLVWPIEVLDEVPIIYQRDL
jgi:hypothetical protein